MIATLNENVISQYSDGSKCSEFIADLRTPDKLTWEAVYWRAKYLFEYAGDICSTQELIGYMNECFNQGLSVAASKDLYIDARRMSASLSTIKTFFQLHSATNFTETVRLFLFPMM